MSGFVPNSQITWLGILMYAYIYKTKEQVDGSLQFSVCGGLNRISPIVTGIRICLLGGGSICGGVALLEEVRHLGVGFEISKPHAFPSFLSAFIYISRCKLSTSSPSHYACPLQYFLP